MTLMERRRALMGVEKEIYLASPRDFTIIDYGTNFYVFKKVQKNFVAEADAGRAKTRRCIYALNGSTKSCGISYVDGSSSQTSDYYPIAIPEGATKIKSVYSDVHGLEAIIFCAIWNGNDWTSSTAIIDTGWVTTESLADIQLNSCTHFTIGFRVDSSNTEFTSETTPSMVKVVFE